MADLLATALGSILGFIVAAIVETHKRKKEKKKKDGNT